MIAIVDGTTTLDDYSYVVDKLDHILSNFRNDNVTIVTNKNKRGACQLSALYATLTSNCSLFVPDKTDADSMVSAATKMGDRIGIVLFGSGADVPDFTDAAAREGIRVVVVF